MATLRFDGGTLGILSGTRHDPLGYNVCLEVFGAGDVPPPRQGAVDVAGVARLLRAAGYDGRYVLERDVVLEAEPAEGDGPTRAAARSLDYLTRTMAT